jgi:hypothetical protein
MDFNLTPRDFGLQIVDWRFEKEKPVWLLFCVFVCLGGADIELIHKAIKLATFDA